jgi:ribosomal protein S18 acetylase RimI-like enzyme
MRTRSPSPADRARLTEIISQGAGFRAEEVSCALELLDAALARAEGNTYEALIAVDGDSDRPIGYACFGQTPMTETTFDLYWLVVAADARGRGIGGELMTAVEDFLRERGARRIRVETSSLEGSGGAARFYAKSGYTRAGIIPDFYRAGDDLLTFLKVL